jgi:hypothetical protein
LKWCQQILKINGKLAPFHTKSPILTYTQPPVYAVFTLVEGNALIVITSGWGRDRRLDAQSWCEDSMLDR